MAQDFGSNQVTLLKRKIERLRRQRFLLALPILILTFPVSVPALLIFEKIRKKRQRLVTIAARKNSAPVMPNNSRVTSTQDVLIWCPIAVAGLTTQLTQLTEILRNAGVDYRVSYHIEPTTDHPEVSHWIEPDAIRNPKVVFYMERYEPFDCGFLSSYHVFYVNLDWLSATSIAYARVYADLVLVPTPYHFSKIADLFPNSRVLHQPWPPAGTIESPVLSNDQNSGPIRVLYIGNDYNERSRKSPYEVVEAILACDRSDLIFDLKFRSPLPLNVHRKLTKCPNVDRVLDCSVTSRHIEKLYREADVNLIPNASEGNGLSILESLSKGVVPVVLDGHPMKDVVSSETAYFLECEQVGVKEFAPLYRTTTEALSRFFCELDVTGIRSRKRAIQDVQKDLAERKLALERLVRDVLAENGLISSTLDRSKDDPAPPNGLFRDRPSYISKPTEKIDVFLTTSRRADLLERSLEALVTAMKASPYRHRLTVMVDGSDRETEAILEKHRDTIFQCNWTRDRLGLPYAWNNIIDISCNMASRTEVVPDFLCYLQDDCLIVRPDMFFEDLVDLAEAIDPTQLGFVSGYFSGVHPGFKRMFRDRREVVISDSVDGKNFMARPKTLYGIGKLTWWFDDGEPRGNPGPSRGSHFDLWQWNESPNCLRVQGRVNAIRPGLCRHIGENSETSTWGNDTSDAANEKRVSQGRAYRTRQD